MKARTTVRLALRARMAAVPSCPAAALYEGERDERPTGLTSYWRETFRPGVARVDGLPAATGTEVVDGVYLVDGFFPIGAVGLAAAEQFAAEVVHAYRPGVPNGTLGTGDPSVGVQAFGASSAGVLRDGVRLQVPITIRWRSQVPNAMTP